MEGYEVIKRTKKEHSGYTEWVDIEPAKRVGVPLLFQRWQYFYTKGKKQMDCVQFNSKMYEGMDFEIYGELIEDVERFSTLAEAESRIEELFKDRIKNGTA